MLKYCMDILQRVSFDKVLFKKEIRKAFLWLNKEERTILKRWLVKKFGKETKSLINSPIVDRN